MVKRLSIFVALVFGGLAFSSLPAQAQESDVLIQTGIITNSWQAQDEVTFSEPGPVDLSGSDHATGNVGERVMLGALDLETASGLSPPAYGYSSRIHYYDGNRIAKIRVPESPGSTAWGRVGVLLRISDRIVQMGSLTIQ